MSPGIIKETKYKMMDTWKGKDIPLNISMEDRIKLLESMSTLSEGPFPSGCCTKVTPMPLHEEVLVSVVWFLFFALLLYGPFVLLGCLYFKPIVGLSVTAVLMIISCVDTKFDQSALFSYLATINLKYFSFRAIWKCTCPPDSTYIGVTPPHGLFPIGGVLGMFAVPRFGGVNGRGAAASAILRFPIVGNLLKLIGCVDATKKNIARCLALGQSVGISSGGVAEVFETNAALGTETIILRSRGGICKLALENGVDIVPAYLFGNCQVLRAWYDPYGIMQAISRKIRAGLCLFWGRWGLPIPFRTPLLAVFDEPIKVKKTANPTPAEIQMLLNELESRIVKLFDDHKAAYGWEHVKLVVK